MPYSSFNLDPNTGYPKTLSASSDYGFDNNIYILCNESIPNNEQLKNLANRYKELLLTMEPKELHNHYINKNLHNILGENFKWTRFTYYLYNI